MEIPKRVVLDTDVMVEHLRGRLKGVVGKLEENAELATTAVNAFELYHGAHRSRQKARNLSAVKNLLTTLSLLTLDDATAERAGEVLAALEKEGTPIEPKDLFVGCIAVQNGCAVVTGNQEHFRRIPGLLVVAPSEI